ncbi:MAG: PQQ-binding-like beta-propeller repeat protein [Pirellulaceae bacterium]
MWLTSALLMTSLGWQPAASSEEWPGWRGPGGLGRAVQAGPVRWTATEGIRWKTPLSGGGISCPIVSGDCVFVTTSDGPRQGDLHLVCLDRDSGQERWTASFWGTAPTLYHATKGGMATPTPVADGKYVYAFFGTGDVFCVDYSGELQWQRSLAKEYGAFENRFGHTSSPILHGDLLIVQCDHYGQSYMVAINRRTGADSWKMDRPGRWHSWSSPLMVTVGGKPQLVVCSSGKVEGLAADTGSTLWFLEGLERECIPTPVFDGHRIYAVSGPKGKTFALRPGGQGDVAATHVDWVVARGGPFVPSPILAGDLLYLVDDQGICTCLDTHNGKRVWQKRLPGAYTASPVAAGGLVYFMNEAGETTIVRAGIRQFEQVARTELGEPVFASPAVADGALFVRTSRHLVRID